MIENFNNFKIRGGLSTDLFDSNGNVKAGVKLVLGNWYLCTDTACVYVGIVDPNNTDQVKLELINSKNFAGKNDLQKYAELAEVYTRGEIDALGFISEIPDEYLTVERLNGILDAKGYLTEHQDLSDYALKSELPSLTGLATEDFVNQQISKIEHPQVDLEPYALRTDLNGLATEAFVREQKYITAEDVPNYIPESFVTEDELADAISKVEGTTADLTGYAKEEWVRAQGYITDVSDKADVEHNHNDLYATIEHSHDEYAAVEHNHDETYASKVHTHEEYLTAEALNGYSKFSGSYKDLTDTPDIPSIAGLASEEYVDQKVSNLEIPSIEGLATETFVTEKIAEAQLNDKDVDLSAYALRSELDGLASETWVQEQLEAIAIPEAPDLSDYALKSELPSIEGLASETFVAEQIAAIEFPQPDLTEYAKKSELPSIDGLASTEYVDQKVSEIEHPSVDLTSYATKDEIKDFVTLETVENQGYLKEHQDLSEYAKKSELPIVPTNISDFANDAGYITLAEVPEVDLSGKADVEHKHDDLYDVRGAADAVKNELLNGAGAAYDTLKELGDLIETNKDALASLEILAGGKADAEHMHDEYALKSELPSIAGLASTGYVDSKVEAVEIGLANYALKSELPSIEGLATESFVTEAIEAIPPVDLEEYAKKSELPSIEGLATQSGVQAALNLKADNVLFTENYLVKTPLGGFSTDESVMGMTVKDILIKLLGLEIYVAPELPDNVPETTPPVINELITNTTPVYALNGSGELVENTDSSNYYVQMTIEEAEAESDLACFYQVVDSDTGELVESGYQIPTVEDSEDWMTVAIPETITKFHIEQFNPLTQTWERVSYTLEPTTNYSIDGYIVYTADGTDGGPTIRIIIEE